MPDSPVFPTVLRAKYRRHRLSMLRVALRVGVIRNPNLILIEPEPLALAEVQDALVSAPPIGSPGGLLVTVEPYQPPARFKLLVAKDLEIGQILGPPADEAGSLGLEDTMTLGYPGLAPLRVVIE